MAADGWCLVFIKRVFFVRRFSNPLELVWGLMLFSFFGCYCFFVLFFFCKILINQKP